jgi:hypothetical protein
LDPVRNVGRKWRDAFTGYELGQEVLAHATHEQVVLAPPHPNGR